MIAIVIVSVFPFKKDSAIIRVFFVRLLLFLFILFHADTCGIEDRYYFPGTGQRNVLGTCS